MNKQKYEYTLAGCINSQTIQHQLGEKGKDGWRVHTIYPAPTTPEDRAQNINWTHILFEREVATCPVIPGVSPSAL